MYKLLNVSSISYQSYKVDSRSGSSVSDVDFISLEQRLNDAKSNIDPYFSDINYSNIFGSTFAAFKLLNDKPDAFSSRAPKGVNKVDFVNLFIKSNTYSKVTAAIQMGEFKKSLKDKWKLEVCSNAWMKCYEMLSRHKFDFDNNNNNDSSILHFGNAELPGNFILATEHFAKNHNLKYDWKASSLIGVSTALQDSYGVLKKNPEKWIMDHDVSSDSDSDVVVNGDLINPEKMELLAERFLRLHPEGCNLYTSDAGFSLDLESFNKQEEIEIPLKMGEILVGLKTLRKGGHMIIKIYTWFNDNFRSALGLLTEVFEEVHLDKPLTSRPANSEVYLVCKNYKGRGGGGDRNVVDKVIQTLTEYHKDGSSDSLVLNKDLETSFFKALEELSNRQIFFIERNIKVTTEIIKSYNINDINFKTSKLFKDMIPIKNQTFEKYLKSVSK